MNLCQALSIKTGHWSCSPSIFNAAYTASLICLPKSTYPLSNSAFQSHTRYAGNHLPAPPYRNAEAARQGHDHCTDELSANHLSKADSFITIMIYIIKDTTVCGWNRQICSYWPVKIILHFLLYHYHIGISFWYLTRHFTPKECGRNEEVHS